MAALFNLARMTVSSSGPGDITLNSAVSGYLTFDLAGCSTAAAGQSLSYAINDITASEIGTATYYSSALAVRGRTPNRSTNGNVAIAMSNAAQVFITPRAEDLYPLTGGATSSQFTQNDVVFVGAGGIFTQNANFTFNGTSLTVATGTASASTATGAIVVTGGLGMSGALHVGGGVTGGSAGSITTVGWAAEFLHASGDADWYAGATIGFHVGTSGDQMYYGRASNLLLNGTATNTYDMFWTTTNFQILFATAAVSTVTGALVLSGGMGLTGAVWAGGGVNSTGTATSSFTQSTATWVATFNNSNAAAGDLGIYVAAGGGVGDVSTSLINFYVSGAVGSPVGSITRNGLAVSYNTTSDTRLKEDPQTFDGAAIVDALKVHDFKWKGAQRRECGVFAQEAVGVYAPAIRSPVNPDDYWMADYTKYVPVLLRAMQQAQARIAVLEAKLGP